MNTKRYFKRDFLGVFLQIEFVRVFVVILEEF